MQRPLLRLAWRTSIALLFLLLLSPVAAPQLLAFPYQARFGTTEVLSERPIDRAAMARVLARSNRLLAASPLADAGPAGQRILLTDGGWRWTFLALSSRSGFALTRPVSDALSGAVIINRSDPSADLVSNGAAMGGRRTLSGTIAHERTHMLVRRRLGWLEAALLPQWKSEGLADHVAQESSLSESDVAILRRSGKDHPALPYYWGRRRVAAELARNGGNVEALLSGE